MLVDALLLSLIVGYLRGGSLRRLTSLEFKFPWLVILAFLVHFFLVPIVGRSLQFGRAYVFYALIVSYLLLLAVIWFNRRDRYIQVMGVGIVLNFLVILLNGGMPVPLTLVQKFCPQGYEYVENVQGFLHIPMVEGTHLKFLGDLIPFPALLPRPSFALVSFGDVFLSVGVFLLVQRGMVYRGRHALKRPIGFKRRVANSK
ncbi:MAG: DUF5317 domain-containing protein [Actinomycetota bacterium]|nr:DUF5317 domain-containing protein [Actinomycetota bacterium]